MNDETEKLMKALWTEYMAFEAGIDSGLEMAIRIVENYRGPSDNWADMDAWIRGLADLIRGASAAERPSQPPRPSPPGKPLP